MNFRNICHTRVSGYPASHGTYVPGTTPLISKPPEDTGLQNTSMYSALRASQRLFTKIDWINFEHHVICDGPEDKAHGRDE